MVRREAGAQARRGSAALRWMIGVGLAMVVVAGSGYASANPGGPILGFTGAPGEAFTGDASCTYGPGFGCHESFAANSPLGTLTIEGPSSYELGMTYLITVDVAQEGQARWGFQLTVLDELLQRAGTLASTDADESTQIQNTLPPRQYVAHSLAGTAPGQPNENSWSFQWTAPDTDVGPVTFYAAGNAANNDGASAGDYIYTTTATVPEPGSLAASLLALSTAAALARRRSGRPA